MEIKVIHKGNARFQIQARHHIIVSDQPSENGGDDAAMTPPELFLASIGSCAAYYAAQFLKSRKLDQQGLEVTVQAEKLRQPARLGNFVIQVKTPVSLSDDQILAMDRSVHHCLIHQTMLNVPSIEIDILADVPAPEPALPTA
ncbi:MAG TPA: OsmC family protein [Acidobacteriaceae bacterium]|nr:OsmC family protein [Acidobacteriaceae bacterium]